METRLGTGALEGAGQGWSAGGVGGDESALELITNTTFCLKACGVYLRCFVHATA